MAARATFLPCDPMENGNASKDTPSVLLAASPPTPLPTSVVCRPVHAAQGAWQPPKRRVCRPRGEELGLQGFRTMRPAKWTWSCRWTGSYLCTGAYRSSGRVKWLRKAPQGEAGHVLTEGALSFPLLLLDCALTQA
ncbi:hypothetical protein QTO34_019981 [Cnephaeus nilssonii]|uniref:Uncharacterized protein n=1 Tax=Cnephaeus nilssonii TaxID=3371016 RepID=A0AA40LPT3_CNENI|nr:hypothetical protein QTO34_019981 [Eptesicus nilssonii]